MIPIKKIFTNFFETIIRFPIPVFCSILSFTLFIVDSHFLKSNDYASKNFIIIKILLSSITAIAAFVAFDIYAETKAVSKATRVGFVLLVFCVLGLHFYTVTPAMFDSETIFVSRYLIFFVIFHLMVSVSAYYKEKELSRFWQFNHYLFIRFFTSVIFSITLILGLVSALWAVENLFGLHFNNKYYTDIILFVALIFNTIFFLMGIPKDYSIYSNPIEYKKALRIFVQYILIPIIAIYFVILYFYLFKIVFLQKIPNGYVCIPILILSIIGILAYLLIYPIRKDRENPMVFVFAKYFYYVLLPLLSLYFIAIIIRIKPYGITEDRYLIFILGIWLLVISVYIIISKKDNIIIIPVSLIVILFLSAIGPWGMFQLSVQNQVLRLERNLVRNHLLENKELLKDKTHIQLTDNDAKSIQSILQFLYKRDELNTIRKWIPEKDLVSLQMAIDSNQLDRLYPVFGIIERQVIHPLNYIKVISNSSFSQSPIDVSGFQFIQNLEAYRSSENEIEQNNKEYVLNNYLNFYKSGNVKQTILLDSLLKKSMQAYNKNRSNSNRNFDQYQVVLEQDSMLIHDANSKLIIEFLEIEKNDSIYTITQLKGYLLYNE